MPTRGTDTSSPASGLSRYINASTRVSDARTNTTDNSACRPVKRRKIVGLNARFDRMIRSVNVTLSCRNSSPAGSRKRLQSSGTSSVSSHDVPKTPVDTYSNLHPGKLGKDFSVLKMRSPPLLSRKGSDRCPKPAAPPKEPKGRLPDWLAHTFCSLEADHPLRGLLSPSRIRSNSPAAHLSSVSHEEELFAFSPFEFDEQEEVFDAAYRACGTLNAQDSVLSVVPTNHSPSHLQPVASADALPFSTPGCFAPVRRSIENPIVDGTLQKYLVPVPQQGTSNAANMMHPSALPAFHLRLDNEIGLPRLTRAFSSIVQDNEPSSDFQEHGACMNHNYQVLRDGDNFNVYATPGPALSCSLPLYFDSPIEDPSLSDSLQPESYDLHGDATDFRWHQFLRSNAQDSDANRQSVSPSFPLGCALPSQVGDQDGWDARFAVDQGEYRASNEELPSLTEDVEIACLDDVGAILPSNVNTSTFDNLIRPWSSPISDVLQQPESALLAADNVPPRGDGENTHTGEELPSLHNEETRAIRLDTHGIQLSTPMKQVPASLPSAPQKVRSSRLCGALRTPLRKMPSALSWVIAVHDDVDCALSPVVADSHDSIESWSERS